ncbi:MAG TPA: peptidoglycan DD-metalloendopeptidase family protein, partial [Micromonosporaceae bacterium]
MLSFINQAVKKVVALGNHAAGYRTTLLIALSRLWAVVRDQANHAWQVWQRRTAGPRATLASRFAGYEEAWRTRALGWSAGWQQRLDGSRAAVIGKAGAFVLEKSASVTRRQASIGLATAAVLIAGLVAGTAMLADSTPTPASQNTAADVTSRQDAANRADRSVRTVPAPAPSASAAPAPSASTKAPAPSQSTRQSAPAPKQATKPATPKAAPKPTKAAPKPAPAWVNPMPGAPISSCFGPRWGTMHQGIDFAGANGTKIRSIGAGTVVAAGWNFSGYGISVVVDHGNGYLSHYAHAQKVLVSAGQKVKPGQALALEGSTGDSTGPHLHFEIHKGMWNQIDPASWLR